MLSKAPDALRADFQHYYQLDLDGLGTTIRVRRAADLAANLPQQAQAWRRLDPRLAWDTTQRLLALIADDTDFIAWTRSAASQQQGAAWHSPLARPGQQARRPAKGTGRPASLTISQLEKELAKPQMVVSDTDGQ